MFQHIQLQYSKVQLKRWWEGKGFRQTWELRGIV